MSDLITRAPATMSSLEIAEITGKRHRDVVRDLKELDRQGVIKVPKFAHLQEIKTLDGHSTGTRTIYLLPKRETLILTSGYSAVQRAAIIDRMLELEERTTSLETERLRQALLESNPAWSKIVRGRQAGFNNQELAGALKCSEKSIRRHIRKLREYGLLPLSLSESGSASFAQLDLFGEVGHA